MTEPEPERPSLTELPVRETLRRLESSFPGADSREPVGQTGTGYVLADLTALAHSWGLSVSEQMPDAQPEPEPGPEALALHADRLGLTLACEARDAGRLGGDDLPAVTMLRGGGSRLIRALMPDGRYLTGFGDGERHLPAAELSREGSGTIFRIGRKTAETVDGAAKPAQGATQDGRKSLRGFVLAGLRGQRSLLLQLITASLLINLIGLALPMFTMAVFDRVIPHAAMETLWALALGVVVALGLELCLRHARLRLFDAAGCSLGLSLQGRLMSRLLFVPGAKLPRGGGAVVQPMQELDGLAQLAPQLVVSLLVDVPFFLVLMLLLASIAGPVTLAPVVGIMAMSGLHVLAHGVAKGSQSAHVGFARRQMQMAIDAVSAQERIRATASGARFLADWEQAADEASHAAHRIRLCHGIAAQGSAVIVQMVVVATIVIGVFRIDAAAMTIGALSAAMLLVNRAMTPIALLIGQIFRARQALEAAAPVGALLETEIEQGGDRQPLRTGARGGRPAIEGRLAIEAARVVYGGETRPALSEITLAIAPGERVGIIGKAGCGKSTLLKLIARLIEPEAGRLFLDGHDAAQYDPAALRRALSYMPQDSTLIDGTIADNMTLGLDSFDESDLERAARLSGVRDLVARHPAGYSLAVGPGGQRLSGGERQCVALGRALAGAPRLLLLDEPTAALDNGLEARIIADLKRELGNTGLLIATHRLALLALVDRIVWLDGGRIVADGPKEEVFARFKLVA